MAVRGDERQSVSEASSFVVTDDLFASIYSRHYPDVYRYLLVLTADQHEAEDLASETFERALQAWRKRGYPSEPLPWLFVTARRAATDRWRRARKFVWEQLGAHTRGTSAVDGEMETWLWLSSFAALLSVRQREVLILRYHQDLSDEDVGRVMGLSPSGVRSLVARALAALRRNPELWR